MINSKTYRAIATLLSISILLGVTLPRDLYAGSDELCDLMTTMHDDYELSMSSTMSHENCPIADMSQPVHSHHASEADSEGHHSAVDCNCSLEDRAVETEARVLQKTKTLVLTVIDILINNHTITHESAKITYQWLDSYSPLPIFLVNESFLI